MTLTNAIDDDQQAANIEAMLKDHFSAVLQRPLQIEGIALFIEPEPGAPFQIHTRAPFADALNSAN